MLLIRWFILSQPLIRISLSILFPIALVLFAWLPENAEWWAGWIAFGYLQSIALTFVGAASVLMLSIPFYLAQRPDKAIKDSQLQVLNDDKFVAKLIWPQRIVALALILYCFSYFTDFSSPEIQIVFGLTLIQFFSYNAFAPASSQRLNFLRFVESGIILLVSIGFAAVLGGFLVLFTHGFWEPSREELYRLAAVFCASVVALYQEYLERKMNRLAASIEKNVA